MLDKANHVCFALSAVCFAAECQIHTHNSVESAAVYRIIKDRFSSRCQNMHIIFEKRLKEVLIFSPPGKMKFRGQI